MDSHVSIEATSLSRILLKLLSIYLITLGFWDLLANLVNSYQTFDPSYTLYYLRTQVLTPSIGIILGILLWLFAPFVARRIAR